MTRSLFARITSISLRQKLWLFLICVLLLASGAIITSGLGQRAQEIEDEKNDAILMVQSIAAQQEQVAIATKQMMNTLVLLPEVQRLDANACNDLFRELQRRHPFYSLIGVTTSNGDFFAASRPLNPGLNIAQQKDIRDAKSTLEFSPGEFMLGRVSNTGVISYALPVLDANNSVTAFIVAGFRLDEFSRFINKVKLPQGFSFSIVDHAGVRLFRTPENAAVPIGKAVSEDTLGAISGEQGEGTFERVEDDGVNRIYAFKQLRIRDNASPYIYMLIGMPKDQIIQKANSKTLMNLLLFAAAAGITVLLGGALLYLSLVKPVARLTSAAQRLGRGDLATRTSLPHTADELGQLAKSFDDMASLLEHRSIEQRKTEEALRESETKYRDLIETTDTGYVIVDKEGRVLDANKEYVRLSGHESVDEILRSSVLDWTALYDLERNSEEISKCAAAGKVRDLEIDYVDRQGNITPVEISGTLIQTAEGRAIICVVKDITERKKIETELQDAYEGLEAKVAERTAELESVNEYLENILDNSPDIISIVDKHGNFIRWNKAAIMHSGYDLEELRGKPVFDLYPDKEQLTRMLNALRHDGFVRDFVIDMNNKYREVTPIQVSISLLKNSEGKVIGSVAVARDLSPLKKANEELQKEIDLRIITEESLKKSEAVYRESEIKYRALYLEIAQVLASIPSFLIGLTADNKIMRWNSAAEKTFNMGSRVVLGKPFHQCGINWDWEKISEAVSICQTGGQATKLHNFRFLQTDGREGFLEVALSPLNCAGNDPPGTLLLGSDSTKRKILESQLAQAQKLESIGQLAAGIAHEINTPAQYVGDNARFLQEAFGDLERIFDLNDQLLEHLKSDNMAEDLVRKIEEAASEIDLEYIRQESPKAIGQTLDGIERISRIVRAMKEFSHPGTDSKTGIDLNKAIESTITVARNEWKYVAEMMTNLDLNLPPVLCLPAEINQVILNMIINASHAIADVSKTNGSDQKGTITIATRAMDNYAEISIGDTGTGIPEDIKAKIFDPFFTTKEVGKGTGQGLAISHSIVVDKHGGSISFDSEVGGGTVFFVRLPLNSGTDQQAYNVAGFNS